jgi:hypothetical protein
MAVVRKFSKLVNSIYSNRIDEANIIEMWKVINPKVKIEELDYSYENYLDNARNLGKIFRAWKATCNVPISGMLIDTMVISFLRNYSYRDKSFSHYDYLTRDFLNFLAKQDPKKNSWIVPGSTKNALREGKFEDKAIISYYDAAKAVELENINEFQANVYWKKIFGKYFVE